MFKKSYPMRLNRYWLALQLRLSNSGHHSLHRYRAQPARNTEVSFSLNPKRKVFHHLRSLKSSLRLSTSPHRCSRWDRWRSSMIPRPFSKYVLFGRSRRWLWRVRVTKRLSTWFRFDDRNWKPNEKFISNVKEKGVQNLHKFKLKMKLRRLAYVNRVKNVGAVLKKSVSKLW